MKIPGWDDYIQAPLSLEGLPDHTGGMAALLAGQRENLKSVLEKHTPRRIVCLGSGFLMDIPIREFLHEDGEVYLVDWIPWISVEGFKDGLIQRGEGEKLFCFICESLNEPEKYCSGFSGPIREPHQVCANFRPAPGERLLCENFLPAREPRFLTADITQGRASRFGRGVPALVDSGKDPPDAFERAIEECALCEAIYRGLPIPAGSVDLVTSSMVVSQFGHEPYAYFSKALEAHIREIHRLVEKKNGKVYFSVELFRADPGSENFFLVHEIPQVMRALDDYFLFDLEDEALSQSLRRTGTGGGDPLMQNYVLSPKEV